MFSDPWSKAHQADCISGKRQNLTLFQVDPAGFLRPFLTQNIGYNTLRQRLRDNPCSGKPLLNRAKESQGCFLCRGGDGLSVFLACKVLCLSSKESFHQCDLVLVDHPIYSSDLTPSEYRPFPNRKKNPTWLYHQYYIWYFWPTGWKLLHQRDPNCSTDERCVWTGRDTMLKYNAPLVTFQESIFVNQWTFQPNFVSG